MLKSIEWTGESLRIIDQTEIPARLVYKELSTINDVYEAIQQLRIRGAPAIGIAAAFGLYLGLRYEEIKNRTDYLEKARYYADYLSKSRPTAANLNWALYTIIDKISTKKYDSACILSRILDLAQDIQKDDEIRCAKIGKAGATLIRNNISILTHCNTGLLATGGIGTALGIIYTAKDHGKKFHVLVDETRPLLQGARLTMWELQQAKIPATLITDGMVAYAMQRGKVDIVIVGADRISTNGDVANKIGTYNLAVNCKYHQIPFYVAAPLSTFDLSLTSGEHIPIEERDCQEITNIWNKLSITASNTNCWNPAFDITPANLISGIITEVGIFKYPFHKEFSKLNKYAYQN